jgi:hypothetical protein
MAAVILDVVDADTFTEANSSPEELADADNLSSLVVEVPDDATDRLGLAWTTWTIGS